MLDKYFNDEQKKEFESKFNNIIIGLEASNQHILDKLKNKEVFSYIRLGDVEGLFLLYGELLAGEISKFIQDKLWWAGIDKNNIPSRKELLKAIETADIVGVQEPQYGIQNFNFWGPTYVALSNLNKLDLKKWESVHAIYQLACNPEFWQSLQEYSILLVGSKMQYFYKFFAKDPTYNREYPDMEFNKLDLVNFVDTPDLPDFANNSIDSIYNNIRYNIELMPDNKPHIVLFSCGYVAKILAPRLTKESKVTTLDIGNVIESIMNFQNRRPYMEMYKNFVHPRYEFVFGPQNQVIEVKEKSNV